jgi:hypothetical protein
MKHDVKSQELRFRVTTNDLARLDEQCKRFELSRAELIKYYIRQGYDAMAEQVVTDIATQHQMFAFRTPGGAGVKTPALPRQPKEENTA